MPKQCFRQQDYCVIELLIIKVVVILAACLLKSCIKYFTPLLIRNHVSLYC
jgi:hypothetical protein